MRGARHPKRDALRVLLRSQESRGRHAPDLHRTDPEAAELEFGGFEADFGEQYPGAIDVWRRAWNEFIPFLDYPPELRRIVYHHERDRVHQLPTPQDYQDSGPFPVGYGGDEATLPRTAEHLK